MFPVQYIYYIYIYIPNLRSEWVVIMGNFRYFHEMAHPGRPIINTGAYGNHRHQSHSHLTVTPHNPLTQSLHTVASHSHHTQSPLHNRLTQSPTTVGDRELAQLVRTQGM